MVEQEVIPFNMARFLFEQAIVLAIFIVTPTTIISSLIYLIMRWRWWMFLYVPSLFCAMFFDGMVRFCKYVEMGYGALAAFPVSLALFSVLNSLIACGVVGWDLFRKNTNTIIPTLRWIVLGSTVFYCVIIGLMVIPTIFNR